MRKLSLFLTFTLSAVLTAQVARNASIPLKNWPAPLYWQPSRAEAEVAHVRPPSPDATMPVGSLVFVAMTPCRVVDTHSNCTVNPNLCSNAQFGPPSLSTNMTRSFPLQLSSTCSVPSNAMAYSFNVTMIPNPPGSFAGYVEVWNTAAAPNTPPTAATILDYPTGDIRSNAAIVPAGINNGSVSAITNATNPLDLTIDINGYYAPQTGITLAQGTASAPSLSFSGDAGTGLFSPGTGILNLASQGRLALSVGGFNQNTALGLIALSSNTTGGSNTAIGFGALVNNTTACCNTASGDTALWSNTTGGNNTANGYAALFNNTTGLDNTASGLQALFSNTTGLDNTASGYFALSGNTTGNYNTATGDQALYHNTTGSSNTALGSFAGYNITTGSNNIDIGNQGMSTDGTAMNSGVIRIGDSTFEKSFFAAGINNSTVSGAAVLVNSNGQLGVASSSRRYKEDIEDLGVASEGLLRLRPVKFRYKKPYADGSKPVDYGLIAEEVAEVYPDLVVKGPDGQIETVQYHKLIPMLLNELQKLKAEVAELRENR